MSHTVIQYGGKIRRATSVMVQERRSLYQACKRQQMILFTSNLIRRKKPLESLKQASELICESSQSKMLGLQKECKTVETLAQQTISFQALKLANHTGKLAIILYLVFTSKMIFRKELEIIYNEQYSSQKVKSINHFPGPDASESDQYDSCYVLYFQNNVKQHRITSQMVNELIRVLCRRKM